MELKEILFGIGLFVVLIIAPVAYWGFDVSVEFALAIVVIGYLLVLPGSCKGKRTHSKYTSSGTRRL